VQSHLFFTTTTRLQAPSRRKQGGKGKNHWRDGHNMLTGDAMREILCEILSPSCGRERMEEEELLMFVML
jgi:hypothetical protein